MGERKHGSSSGGHGRGRVARAAGVAGGLALTLLAASAGANGRFPRAQRLIQDATNPGVMALYGTYGLLVTRDAGASWRHVCEAVTGTYAGEDPLLEIMAGEHVLLRSDAGLSRSAGSLCDYDAVLGSSSDALQDITRDSGSPDGVLALSTALGDDGVFISRLSSSSDGGATFTPLGSIPPEVLERGLTLDVAPSQPELVYVSGIDALGRGKLARSSDRGQSFVGLEIPGLGVSAPPYIAAVSALDPDRVFVRTDVFERANGDFEARETASDSLYFTPDGGQTWHMVLHRRGKLYGFALSPDEQWLLAGYGDPVLPAIFVEPDELGLYRVAVSDLLASPEAPPWERIYDRGVTCLRWTEEALFACVAQDENGFEVGRAPDASFSLADAAPFQSFLRLPDVLPLECPAESAGATCLTEETTGWQTTCNVLRASCDLDASGAAGSSGEGGSSDPGASGATGAGASSPSDPAAPAGSGGASPSPSAGSGAGGAAGTGPGDEGAGPSGASAPKSSGGCSVVPSPRGEASAPVAGSWLAAVLLLAWRLRARRHHARRPRVRRLLALAALAPASLGCSDGEASDTTTPGTGDPADPTPARPPVDCGGAAEDFVLGMSKASSSGALTVAIEAADPAPPLVGRNSWIVQLSTESGEPITAARVSLTGWMPQHGHGLSSVPLTTELDGGRYEIRPINLFMPQLWEFDVAVAQGEEREVVTFSFCVR